MGTLWQNLTNASTGHGQMKSLPKESLYLPWQIKQQTQKRFRNLSKPSSFFFVLSLCFFTPDPDPDQLTSTQIPRWQILQVI
ncbi:hypothetical protein V6N13_119506 [Hibiscus sabdariffa]